MGNQACWNRSKALAAARGGARAGKPRWVRILVITEGCSMAAMIFKVPPDWGQCSIAKPLARSRQVWRYTTHRQAGRDARYGIRSNSHMTAQTTRGRAPSPEAAQRRYGLPHKPRSGKVGGCRPGHPCARTLGRRARSGRVDLYQALAIAKSCENNTTGVIEEMMKFGL